VIHEIEALAVRDITSMKPRDKDKDKDKESSEAPSPPDSSAPIVPTAMPSVTMIPGFKKLSSLSLEPEDAITLRARVIRFKHLAGQDAADGDNAFEHLRRLVERISVAAATETELFEALKELADLFATAHTSVSSFELLQSGVVDGLLQFATNDDRVGKACLILSGLTNSDNQSSER
jgi:E3 ubiquitin-protein ligase TRIP12